MMKSCCPSDHQHHFPPRNALTQKNDIQASPMMKYPPCCKLEVEACRDVHSVSMPTGTMGVGRRSILASGRETGASGMC